MRILTIDLEEWFQVLDTSRTHHPGNWGSFPARVEGNTARILDLLAEKQQPATFFVMGWIARRYPELVKNISKSGYGVAFHSMDHRPLTTLTPAEFRTDVRAGRQLLEDLTGKAVTAYRAPFFSLKRSTRWALPILAEEGYTVDTSLFSSLFYHAGFNTLRYNAPFRIDTSAGGILEFPMNSHPVAGYPLVFSGGGFFRMLPYNLIHSYTRRSGYVMGYFHPRDFDTTQPRPRGLTPVRSVTCYMGVNGAFGKFSRWLSDFRFIDLETAVQTIHPDKLPVVKDSAL